MRKPAIYIGTSGFSYKHWKEIFYPLEVKPLNWLLYYSERFKITEINATFKKNGRGVGTENTTKFYVLPKDEPLPYPYEKAERAGRKHGKIL